jgi:hypothetical protein
MTMRSAPATVARVPVTLGLVGVILLASIWIALPARAGVGLSVAPDFPPVVTSGETDEAASLTIANQSDGDDSVGTLTITSVTMVTACSVAGDTGCNNEGSTHERGIINLSAGGTGRAETACAGQEFDINLLDPATSVYEFNPHFGSVVLEGPNAGNHLDQCTIDFTFSVEGRLSTDASGDPALQTAQVALAFAVHSGSGNLGSGSGSDITTVVPPAAADFNGGGTDIAIWRPSTGQWFVRNQFTLSWGLPEDVPVAGDYNGEGTTDIAIWRPSTGQWFVRDQFTVSWGLPGDVPVPADFDGDGSADIAIWRPSTGQWFIRNQLTASWGLRGDVPVPGDYDGDGTADLAVWRPSTGRWFIQDEPVVSWGLQGDVPVPADYNGDGITEPAVFREGQWLFEAGGTAVSFGLPQDVPAPLPAPLIDYPS